MKNIYRLLAILLTITYAWSVETSTLLETNENIPTDGTEVTYISGETFKNKKVTYSIKDNLAFIEGDILLGTVDEVESWREAQENQANDGKESVIITGSRYRWKNGILPYSIAAGVDNATRRLVSRAIAHWESRTPVRFVRRTARNASKYPSYVEVVSRKPNQCFSSVGQISKSRKQQLNVVAACGFGGVVHEFGHALGLWHEQSRADRNRFIRINYGNIKNGQSHNFNQHITDGDDIGHYDYGSIMHYGRKAFSKNGRDTITVLKSGVSIGQRRGLSAGDIASIKKMYPNKVGKSNITSPRNNTAVQANRNITLRWANRGATRKYLRISARVRGRYQTIYRGNVRGTSKNFRLPTGFTAADVVLNSYNGSRYIGRSSIHLRSRGGIISKSNITSPRNNTAVQANRNITLRWANRGATRKYLRISARVRGRYQTIYRGNVRGTSKNFRLPTGFTAADVVLYSYNGSRYIGRSSIRLRSRR